MATFEKERRYPRYKPQGLVIGWRSRATRMASRAEMVGMGGLFLHTKEPAPVGSIVELFFDVKGGEVRAQAVVRDSVTGKGMGVQFVQMRPDDRARLSQFLLQCGPIEPAPRA